VGKQRNQGSGAPAAPRFIRESAEARRQALIQATARCLAERGVAGTSVRAICARAGVSSGLLTHYFDGIDALVLATYRDVGARVSAATDAAVEATGSDPAARLRAFLLANFRPPVLDADLLGTWIGFWSLVRSNPRIASVHAETYAEYRGRLESLLGQCKPRLSTGQIRLAAIGLTALVDGLWLELCLDPSTFSAEEAQGLVSQAADRILAD
jgi:AcrR family transcriptional regulator